VRGLFRRQKSHDSPDYATEIETIMREIGLDD